MKHYMLCLFVALCVLLVPACGSDEITQTYGDFMEEMAVPLCERMATCGFFPGDQVDDCVDGFVTGICEGNCSERLTVSTQEWNDCLNAYEDHSCSSLDAFIYPSECLTIDGFQ
jgi:hypothetical protein